MKTLVKIVLVVVIAFITTTTVYAQEWTKAQKEVWQVVENSWTNWKAWDINGIFGIIHEKYQGWNTQDPLPTSKEKYMQWYKEMKDSSKIVRFDIEPARIVVTENAAVVDYYFSYSGTYIQQGKTNVANISGKNVEFYVKEGGKWLLLGDLTAPNETKK